MNSPQYIGTMILAICASVFVIVGAIIFVAGSYRAEAHFRALFRFLALPAAVGLSMGILGSTIMEIFQ